MRARSPFDSSSLALGVRSGQALGPLVKARAFGMTHVVGASGKCGLEDTELAALAIK
jgi:hypothetical protein